MAISSKKRYTHETSVVPNQNSSNCPLPLAENEKNDVICCQLFIDILTRPIICKGKHFHYVDSKYWCNVLYYEHAKRIGDIFQGRSPALVIDNHSGPSNSRRFCLGSLKNPNRIEDVSRVLNRLGKGILLNYVNGDVYLECLGGSSVFVQSPNCSQQYGWNPATVIKVEKGNYLKIFNTCDFARLISKSIPGGYEAMQLLLKMCTIRLSFIKGWGQQYTRSTVLSTPCWIEIQLNAPLELLNKILSHMRQ